ncbi:hypothetical protein VNI00_019123 [Paramarasmius palmivorus]|uniref:PSP proline-rich domain-containing protein n=1 Tax=Paramarasmius palmivorus TaxID=297713 RepID=A0AAW0ASH9_9AGAR
MRATIRVASRLPRFTLYSGPNCSLLWRQTAKEELAKVRQQRQFQLDIVNIQDPGQERWKRKYVYWIPALHLEGKEIAKGRWDATVVTEALKKWDAETEPDGQSFTKASSPTANGDAALSSSELSHIPSEYLFFSDNLPELPDVVSSWMPASKGSYINGIYLRNSELVIGDPDKEDSKDSLFTDPLIPHCFNCGSPEHNVSSCPFRVDRELVALSRQYYEFFRDLYDEQRIGHNEFSGRLYSVEDWKRTRLSWLDHFVPGEIKGPELRDALGIGEDHSGDLRAEWLQNMALWGYPPGWASHENPQQAVRERIAHQFSGIGGETSDGPTTEEFYVFDTPDTTETILLSEPHEGDKDIYNESATVSEGTLDSSDDRYQEPVRRWATYPNTYFSSSLLPVYNGFALPAVGDDLPHPPPQILISELPPPPSTTPPPLPPPPPIPLDAQDVRKSHESEESDMEMSDEE